jgi:hypothetical protein
MLVEKINSKAVLIVDGHWFARSRHAVLRKDNPCTFTDTVEQDKQLYMSKLTMDLSAEIRNCTDLIDDIVIVHDYKSWRKDIKQLNAPWENPDAALTEYKGNRVYDQEINWGVLHNTTHEWSKKLQQHFNVTTIKAYGAEGDDIMHILSELYNKAGVNVILYSTDGDLTQLCRTNENGTYTALYKKKAGTKHNNYRSTNVLICNDALANSIAAQDPIDVFSYDPSANSCKTFMLNHFNDFERHYIPAYVFYKCIMGDAGDNVKPLMQRSTASKTFRVNVKHIDATLEKLSMNWSSLTLEHLYDIQFVKTFTTILHSEFFGKHMLTLPDSHKQYYINKFVENRQLVYLSTKEMPKSTLDSIKKSINDNIDTIKVKANVSAMYNYESVLEKLEIKAAKVTAVDDFFNNIQQ